MKHISIKKENKTVDGENRFFYVVSALTFKQKDNTVRQQIPHPLGTDIMEFETLEDAKKAIELSGFTYILPNGEMPSQKPVKRHKELDFEEDILTELLKLAKDSNSSVVASAIFALGELKDKKLLPIFVDKMGEDNENIRNNAINAIVNLASLATNATIKALEDENWVRRKSAITVVEKLVQLGLVKPESFFAPLMECFYDTNNIVKCAAINACGKIYKTYRED